VDESVTLSVQRERYVAALARDLAHVVEQLGSIPSVQKVILFGSYAAGRRDLLTDLDILVVMDSPLAFIPRNVELARRVRAGVALDLLAYTPRARAVKDGAGWSRRKPTSIGRVTLMTRARITLCASWRSRQPKRR